MSHGYEAYGLAIQSNQPLTGLAPSDATRVDLGIDFAEGRAPVIDDGAAGTTAEVGSRSIHGCGDGGRLLLFASHGGENAWSMRVAGDGRLIEVRWRGPIEVADIAALVEVMGLSTALALRCAPLLHGCAVEVGARAFVALGEGGAGKSSLAAAALAAGHALLTDDLAALDAAGSQVQVHPGAAQLRMNDDTARALGWNPAELPTLFASPALPRKRFARLSSADGSLCDGPRPLAAIFVLRAREGREVRIERLSPAAALPFLLRNTFGDRAVEPRTRAALLPFWTRLAREVPVHAVARPDGLDTLPSLVEALAAAAMISGA
jgi:hypothetical protein